MYYNMLVYYNISIPHTNYFIALLTYVQQVLLNANISALQLY